mmetsp:Transcript_6562/g.16553  ORF Transcript_6562/g.16553 Transcript_6562/m.16553 type:complete len:440 (+) Transcript_6562:121-1440(+)
MILERSPEGRLVLVLNPILFALSLDQWGDLWIVDLRDVREEVMHRLVVETTAQEGGERRVVRIVDGGDHLHVCPVHVHNAVGANLGPIQTAGDVVHLEDECQIVAAHQVRDRQQQRGRQPADQVGGQHPAVREPGELAEHKAGHVEGLGRVHAHHTVLEYLLAVAAVASEEQLQIVEAELGREHAIERRHVQVLETIHAQVALRRLDATRIRITGVDVRIDVLERGVRMMAQEVLMQPVVEGGTVHKVVDRTQQTPGGRRVCQCKVTGLVHRHQREQCGANAHHHLQAVGPPQRVLLLRIEPHRGEMRAHQQQHQQEATSQHVHRVMWIDVARAQMLVDHASGLCVELGKWTEGRVFMCGQDSNTRDLCTTQHSFKKLRFMIALKDLSRVTTCIEYQGVTSSRMNAEPRRHIVDTTTMSDVSTFCCVMLSQLFPGELTG